MIHYVARWNPKNEKNTWSGTTYFLYEALKSKTTIDRIDAPSASIARKVIAKLTKIPLNYNYNYMNH
ncbi:hypothetical protein, partial [Lactiplantibacillus garii]|uniref:hypothetical protein n=1 Tax=Lactiplantibacillus garii TaxID=2306423 RepID=UPI00384CED38